MTDPIRTSVGWVAHGHNLFRGYSLRDDLIHDGIWSLLSLAIGHRRLSAAESRYLDELAAVLPAPDPRLWPPKLMWLVGCHGSAYAAAAAAHLMMDSSWVGPGCMPGAALLWRELHEMVTTLGRSAAIDAWIAKYEPVPFPQLAGFGAPGRRVDERIEFLEAAVERHGHAEGPYYRLLVDLQAAMEPTSMRVNINGAFAACALDLGFDPQQIGIVGEFILQVPLWANAVDAARIQPAALRQLDSRDIEYVGPAPRQSPRAQKTED